MVCNPEDVDLQRVSEVRGQRAPMEQTAADRCRERERERDAKLKNKTDNSAMNISSSYSGDPFTRQSVSGLQK